MEDVWKDITLSSLHFHHHHSSASSSSASETATSFRSMVLKDFLSTSPFLNDPPPPPPPTATGASTFTSPASIFTFPSPTIAPQPHPPATALSLNSTPEFHFLDAGPHSDHLQINLVPNFGAHFDAFSSPFLSSFGKKRFFDESEAGSGDRRHKRMIKNRESAARSRARKQAYVNELEQEVAHLIEENARLRRQQQQQHHMQEPHIQAHLQIPKRKQQQRQQRLQRTLTAPF